MTNRKNTPKASDRPKDTMVYRHNLAEFAKAVERYKTILHEQITMIDSVVRKVNTRRWQSATEEVCRELRGVGDTLGNAASEAQSAYENICPMQHQPLGPCDMG